jgi:hypothetical protein
MTPTISGDGINNNYSSKLPLRKVLGEALNHDDYRMRFVVSKEDPTKHHDDAFDRQCEKRTNRYIEQQLISHSEFFNCHESKSNKINVPRFLLHGMYFL